MKDQIIRVVGSLGITILATMVYQVVVVPQIEPDLRARQTSATGFDPSNFLGQQKRKLAQYFPPRSWQLGSTKVLESNKVMLLMKDFKEVGDNRLELTPLTIIAFETEEEPEKWNRPVIVLNAESALLEFSELNLTFGKIGDLMGGRLSGSVQITRKSADDKHEPLNIMTSDVSIARDRIETKKDVQFQIGAHQGSGRHLIVQFDEAPKGRSSKGPNISGLSVLELLRVDQVVLSSEGHGLLGEVESAAAQTTARGNQMYASAPVEIRCQGPFAFDGKQRVATFRDQVQVQRLVAYGVRDQLKSDLLEIHFLNPDEAALATEANDQAVVPEEGAAGVKKLKMSRLVAVGSPFEMDAASISAKAQGRQMNYDLIRRRIEVVGKPNAILEKGTQQFQAPSLQYELAANPNHLGRVWAAGPGSVSGTFNEGNDKPADKGVIQWGNQLRIEPKNGEYIVSLEGQASVNIDQQGKIEGEQLYVWLRDATPANEKRQKLLPDRMQGIGRINIETPQLVAQTKEIKAWFQHDLPTTTQGVEPNKLPPSNDYVGPSVPVSPVGYQTGKSASANPPEQTPPDRYHLLGEEIQLVVRLGEKVGLDNATVTGNVQLSEVPTAGVSVDPFRVRGNVVQLVHATGDHAEIHVTGHQDGKPAVVSGRGIQLFGGQFHVSRREQRIWSDGAGRMTLPLDRDFQGRKLAVPEYFDVEWHGGVQAQHDQLTFHRAVKIIGRHSRLTTAKLTVGLTAPLDFFDLENNKNLSAKTLACSGGVQVFNRTSEQGTLKSIENFEGRTLTINQQTGELYAQGPGTAKSVFIGSSSWKLPGQENAANQNSDAGLSFLRVDFLSHVSGNIHRKDATFHKIDRAIFGPVNSWEEELEPKSPTTMRTSDILLRCDQLTVAQLSQGQGNDSGEIMATGNAEVQGRMFHASADKITYTTAKKLLTLRGNGRNDVQLIHQKQIGGSRETIAAGTIEYWPEIPKLKITDGKEASSGFQSNPSSVPRIPGLR